MTWTEFTSYLDGSRPLRKAERDELYDNLDELLTGDCDDAGYSLNATAQTAIKASRLRTDLASLDGPGATNTTGRLHAVLEEASGAFVNYDDAVADALSAEGLTSTERDAIISARLDDWRLWNYYRRVIDALECCTPATVADQSASGTVGAAFSHTITAGGSSPRTYAASGLPAGLSLNTSTGAITGTPTTAGTTGVTVTVTNDCGEDTATLTITIAAAPCDFTGIGDVAAGATGGCYDETFDVTGEFSAATLVSFGWTGGDSVAFEVKANGSTIWTSGCLTSFAGSASFTVPAGTTSLQVLATCNCTATDPDPGTSYSFTIECP